MSEERMNKIDDAIQRLAVVAGDLSKMLAVHEHRITYQEKTSDNIVISMEKRRAEVDNTLKDLYSTIRSEINAIRETATDQHNEQNAKIHDIQKTLWKAVGAITILSWATPFVFKLIFP